MTDSFRAFCVLLPLFVFTLLLAPAARAEEFVSDQYGFRFRIPDGFRERADDTPTTLKMFAEDEEQVNGYLITIHIQPLGQIVDPSRRLDPAELPKKDGLTLSLETRSWQELELQVIRQDITIAPDVQFVGYLIQIPLADEAVQIRIQGPKSRAEEVLSAFNESVQGFVNTKTYIVKSEIERPGQATQAAMQFIGAIAVPCVMVAIVVLFVIFVRRSQAKTSLVPIAGAWRTLPNESIHGRRPTGIAILAGLSVFNGAWIGGQRLLMIADAYTSSHEQLIFSHSYKLAASSDIIIASVATVSGVGLFIGAKWGWWLSAFLWSCRICRNVAIPIAATYVTDQSAGSASYDRFDVSRASAYLYVPALILVYLFRKSVVRYFGFKWPRKVWALTKIVSAGFLVSIILYALNIRVR